MLKGSQEGAAREVRRNRREQSAGSDPAKDIESYLTSIGNQADDLEHKLHLEVVKKKEDIQHKINHDKLSDAFALVTDLHTVLQSPLLMAAVKKNDVSGGNVAKMLHNQLQLKFAEMWNWRYLARRTNFEDRWVVLHDYSEFESTEFRTKQNIFIDAAFEGPDPIKKKTFDKTTKCNECQ